MGTLRKIIAHIVYYRVILIMDSVKPEQMVFHIFYKPHGTLSAQRFPKMRTGKKFPCQCTISFPRKYYFFSVCPEEVLFPFRIGGSTISFPDEYIPLSKQPEEVLFPFQYGQKYYFFSVRVHAPFPNS